MHITFLERDKKPAKVSDCGERNKEMEKET